jgi:hypothetical protein
VKVIEGGTAAEVKLNFNYKDEFCFTIQSVQHFVVENLVDSFIEVYEPNEEGAICKDPVPMIQNSTFYLIAENKSQIFYNIPSDLVNCSELPPEWKNLMLLGKYGIWTFDAFTAPPTEFAIYHQSSDENFGLEGEYPTYPFYDWPSSPTNPFNDWPSSSSPSFSSDMSPS